MNYEKKFEIDKRQYKILEDGTIVYKIRALRDIQNNLLIVNKGDYGGYVQKEENLNIFDDSWIFDDSVVRDDAKVCGSSSVFGRSEIKDDALICDYAIVEGGFVCDNAVVSGRAKVKRSIIANNAVVSGPSFVYQSHIWNNASVFEIKMLKKATIDNGTSPHMIWEDRNKKYELIPEGNLFRIRALRDIDNYSSKTPIKAGDFGGLVSGGHNLSRFGECWISANSMVVDNATVQDYAFVTGGSLVKNNAVVCNKALIVGSNILDNAYISGKSQIIFCEIDNNTRIATCVKLLGEKNKLKKFDSIDKNKNIRLTYRREVRDNICEREQHRF